MKNLRFKENIMPILLYAALIFLMTAMGSRVFPQLPPNQLGGDNPCINVLSASCRFEQGTTLILGYIDNDTFRLVNSYYIDSVSAHNGITLSIQGATSMRFPGDTYLPGLGNDLKDGFDYKQQIHAALLRDNKVYKVVIDSIFSTTNGIRIISPVEWLWYPKEVYWITYLHASNQVIDVYPTQYLEWLLKQCPEFPVGYGETIESDWYSETPVCYEKAGKTICVYKDNPKINLNAHAEYCQSKIFDVVQGTGMLKLSSVDGWSYVPSEGDRSSGAIILSLTAVPFENCGLSEPPNIYLKYNFIREPLPSGAVEWKEENSYLYNPPTVPLPELNYGNFKNEFLNAFSKNYTVNSGLVHLENKYGAIYPFDLYWYFNRQLVLIQECPTGVFAGDVPLPEFTGRIMIVGKSRDNQRFSGAFEIK